MVAKAPVQKKRKRFVQGNNWLQGSVLGTYACACACDCTCFPPEVLPATNVGQVNLVQPWDAIRPLLLLPVVIDADGVHGPFVPLHAGIAAQRMGNHPSIEQPNFPLLVDFLLRPCSCIALLLLLMLMLQCRLEVIFTLPLVFHPRRV